MTLTGEKAKWCGEKPALCHFVHPKVTWADRRSNPSLSGEKRRLKWIYILYIQYIKYLQTMII